MDLEAAVRKHSEMLYRICIVILGSEQDTQDAIQETFCKYLEKKTKFVDGEHEKAWLIKVATNHCRDIQRFRFRHPKVSIEELAGTLVSPAGGQGGGKRAGNGDIYLSTQDNGIAVLAFDAEENFLNKISYDYRVYTLRTAMGR